MRKWIRLGLCLGLLTVALTCSALAATEGYTTDLKGNVTYADGVYTASYDGTTENMQYALLVVEGTPDDYSVSEETLMYIDQKAAGADGISFDFIPRGTPNCVVLLGGEFTQETSPVLLGTLIGQGVNVSGTVTLEGRTDYSGATVTLTGNGEPLTAQTDKTGAYSLDGVATGNYTLTITMPGYLSYTKTTLAVADSLTVDAKHLLGGDVNGNNQVTIDDLSAVLTAYLTTTDSAEDINGNGQVTVDDLSILLSNYLKNASVED